MVKHISFSRFSSHQKFPFIKPFPLKIEKETANPVNAPVTKAFLLKSLVYIDVLLDGCNALLPNAVPHSKLDTQNEI